MRPRTLRRRGTFYHRKRSHWRLNLALGLIGVALAGVVVVDILAWPQASGPAEDAAKRTAAAEAHAPVQTVPAASPPTKLALAASAPISPRPRKPDSQVAGPAPNAGQRALDASGASFGAPGVHDVKIEDAPVQRAPERAVTDSPSPSADEVPF